MNARVARSRYYAQVDSNWEHPQIMTKAVFDGPLTLTPEERKLWNEMCADRGLRTDVPTIKTK